MQKSKTKQTPSLSRHCIGTLITKNSSKLFDGPGCQKALEKILEKRAGTMLGQQMHFLPNNSFTLLVALSESHISIHTWPERLTVQLDVFLCNYLHDNTKKCELIYNDIVEYFESTEIETTFVERL